MQDIPITKFFDIPNPKEYKLHAATWNKEEEPLDVYVESREKWVGWNTWRNDKDEFSRKYIFSVMNFYHETDMWLFGGIYEVLKRENFVGKYGYKIKEIDEYSGYVGRLKIKMAAPSRGRAFYLEKHIGKMVISEILKQPYSGEAFPGYEKICRDFSQLIPIFENEKPDWKAALENVKGIYVIMDRSNGKKYVGSAYGDRGIWSRWRDYMGTGHGGNDDLKELIKKEGREHAKKNFILSLLEYRPMKADDEVIIEREKYWKKVFLSQDDKWGYNRN